MVRLTDRPDMTVAVDLDVNNQTKQNFLNNSTNEVVHEILVLSVYA